MRIALNISTLPKRPKSIAGGESSRLASAAMVDVTGGPAASCIRGFTLDVEAARMGYQRRSVECDACWIAADMCLKALLASQRSRVDVKFSQRYR